MQHLSSHSGKGKVTSLLTNHSSLITKYYPLITSTLLAILLLASVRPYVVTGPSMRPAFEPDDRVLVERLSPKLGFLGRGDTIVFPDPRDPAHPITVKRIVGLPNETIRVEATQVIVTKPDGTTETFEHGTLLGGIDNGDEPKETKLGPEDYFVMGDNREESTDSRDWGTIQPHEMIGQPIIRLRRDIQWLVGSE